MPSNRFASCSHLCCPAQILFLNALQATDRREGSAPTQSSCLKRTQKKATKWENWTKTMTTRITRPPQDMQIFVFNNVEPSHLMVPIPETHRYWSSSLWICRACQRASLVYFIWIPNSCHGFVCPPELLIFHSWKWLWCQVAVPRRPARQFPVSARSTPSLQYGWFCVSDLQDVDKNRMPKIIQNHLEFVWTGFCLRIYLFWIRSCCVCSFAMAITRNMGKFHKPKGCTATTGAFQRVCEKIPVTAAGWTKSKKHPRVTSFAWGIGSLRIDA